MCRDSHFGPDENIMSGMRFCKECGFEKPIAEFGIKNRNKKTGKIYYSSLCRPHDNERQRKHRQENKEELKARFKERYHSDPEFREKVLASSKRYKDEHREELNAKARENFKEKWHTDPEFRRKSEDNKKRWIENNREYHREKQRQLNNTPKAKARKKKWQQGQRKNNINYNIKHNVSRTISNYLKNFNRKKDGESCLKYLDFTIQELRDHLEGLWEPWMNWDNWGIYNALEWDDNDPTTWKWHIDHIIPQSELPYDSMEHPNFKKCWALENLRPYNAKLNLIEGGNRKRHKNKSRKKKKA